MQSVRPRILNMPLQLGPDVQMHRQLSSRFLIDTLNFISSGFVLLFVCYIEKVVLHKMQTFLLQFDSSSEQSLE